ELIDPSTMTPSAASARVAWALQLALRTPGTLLPANAAGVGVIRLGLAVACAVGQRLQRDIEHRQVSQRWQGARVRGEWVGGEPVAGTPILFYVHGSGYIGCSPKTHRGLVARLARLCDRPAFSVGYRLAPRHRFPAGHEDVVNGYLWLLDNGFRAEDIVVAGDSAGGHLALALCGELRRRGLAQPAGVVAFSPLIDP